MYQYSFGIQKHNYDKNGLPLDEGWVAPNGELRLEVSKIFDDEKKYINAGTRLRGNWLGATCFLVLSIGHPRTHFLWECFTVNSDLLQSKQQLAGPGWMLNPPVRLIGAEWDEFERATRNVIGFRQIDQLSYSQAMLELAKDRRRPGVFDSETISFLSELAPYVNYTDFDFSELASGIVTEAARTLTDHTEINHALASITGLIHQLREMGWTSEDLRPFRVAERKLKSKIRVDVKSAGEPTNTRIDEEKVDELRRRLAEVIIRDRQDCFRAELIAAYGGRCAISGTRGGEVLEAAHVRPYSGPASSTVQNGLLLRADLHRLFDRHLIAIDPMTFRISVSTLLKSSDYHRYKNVKLRLPRDRELHPATEALRERWQLFKSIENAEERIHANLTVDHPQ